jgi:hypothetical protein
MILVRHDDGRYRSAPRGTILPDVPQDELVRLLGRRRHEDETALVRGFRRAIRDRRSDPQAG